MNTFVLVIFVIVMIANVVALVRHYMMLRVMTIALKGFEENHRLFNEALEIERERKQSTTTIAPE